MWWTEFTATNIQGYCLYRQDRLIGKGGGVCIYVKDSIKSFEVSNAVLKRQQIEQIWCSIEIANEIILCAAYIDLETVTIKIVPT
jgi:hypothetical protein